MHIKIISIITTIIIVCFSPTSIYATKSDAMLSTQCGNLYNVSYYTDQSYLDEGIACKITSYEELENQFPKCEEILSKYDEAFFEKQFLYRVNYHAPNPAWDVKVTNVIDEENSISVEVTAERHVKEGYYYPDVIVPWDIFFEFDKSHIDKTFSAKVKREKLVDGIYTEAFGQSDAVFIRIDYYPCDKAITVGNAELYYNNQKNAHFGIVNEKDIDMENESVVIGINNRLPATFTYGNLDDDDVVDSADLQIMKMAVRGESKLDGKYLIASDLDGDGLCDTADLLELKQKIKSNRKFSILK